MLLKNQNLSLKACFFIGKLNQPKLIDSLFIKYRLYIDKVDIMD